MIDDADRFRDCLRWAEEELHWCTDPRVLDRAAEALARIEPGNVLAEHLALRAAELRSARREMVRRTTLLAAFRPRQPTGIAAHRV